MQSCPLSACYQSLAATKPFLRALRESSGTFRSRQTLKWNHGDSTSYCIVVSVCLKNSTLHIWKGVGRIISPCHRLWSALTVWFNVSVQLVKWLCSLGHHCIRWRSVWTKHQHPYIMTYIRLFSVESSKECSVNIILKGNRWDKSVLLLPTPFQVCN